MTADALIIELGKRGVEISRRTLFAYRKSDPREVPDFGAVDDWVAFILKRQVYEPGRTQSPEQREAKERRAMSRDETESSAEDQNGEYSPAVERRERIIKLRLGNEARRTSLEVLRQNTITVSECEATMNRIRAVVSAELLKLPASLCHELAGRDSQRIQQLLNTALRSSLERLDRLENYLCSNP
jgi:hypothetical protein